MSYSYTNGDGLDALDASTPVGAVEPVSNLDDAIRQIKAFLLDPLEGVQAIKDSIDPLKVIVSLNATQNFASGVAAAIVQFNNEDLDNKDAFDATTYTFTAPTAGLYAVNIALKLNVTASAAPTDVRAILTVAIDGTTGAKAEWSHDASVLAKQITLNRRFDLSQGQTLTAKLQVTVATNSITYQATADATESVMEIVRMYT